MKREPSSSENYPCANPNCAEPTDPGHRSHRMHQTCYDYYRLNGKHRPLPDSHPLKHTTDTEPSWEQLCYEARVTRARLLATTAPDPYPRLTAMFERKNQQ